MYLPLLINLSCHFVFSHIQNEENDDNIIIFFAYCYKKVEFGLNVLIARYEPRREKTGLRGFRPGPTQTGLYKLRKELEA